jgi:hypothetical protein
MASTPPKPTRIADAKKLYHSWVEYFKRPASFSKSAYLLEMRMLVDYITYLREAAQPKHVWDLPSGILGFGLGCGLTLIISFLRSTY